MPLRVVSQPGLIVTGSLWALEKKNAGTQEWRPEFRPRLMHTGPHPQR